MERESHFFTLAWRTSSPLWLWAAHFTLCYAGVAVGCRAGWHGTMFAGGSALHWMLGTATVAALVLAVVALWRACRRAAHDRGFAARVQALSSGLALAGIAWNLIPLLVLSACRDA
jgi:hypothetical protein